MSSRDGVIIPGRVCPFDKKPLLGNRHNSEWCTNIGCGYFIHNGAVVLQSRIEELNGRYAHLIKEKVVIYGQHRRPY